MSYTYQDVEINLPTRSKSKKTEDIQGTDHKTKSKFMLLRNLNRSKFNGSFMIFVCHKKQMKVHRYIQDFLIGMLVGKADGFAYFVTF